MFTVIFNKYVILGTLITTQINHKSHIKGNYLI